MSKKIYLQAGNTNLSLSPVELLEEASKKIGDVGESLVSSLYLSPSVGGEGGTLEIELWPLTKRDSVFQDAIELMKQEDDDHPAFSRESVIKRSINLLEVWNSNKKEDLDKVSNVATLLQLAADELRSLGKVEVIDIILHSIIDDDALARSYIRIYYKNK